MEIVKCFASKKSVQWLLHCFLVRTWEGPPVAFLGPGKGPGFLVGL